MWTWVPSRTPCSTDADLGWRQATACTLQYLIWLIGLLLDCAMLLPLLGWLAVRLVAGLRLLATWDDARGDALPLRGGPLTATLLVLDRLPAATRAPDCRGTKTMIVCPRANVARVDVLFHCATWLSLTR